MGATSGESGGKGDASQAGAGRRARSTRRRITAAARELIAEVGLEQARIDDIATRARVGRSTFYLHFRGKSELANAIAVGEMETLEASWIEFARIDPTHLDAVNAWFCDLIDVWRRNRSLTVISIEYGTNQQQLAAQLVAVQYAAAEAFVGELGRLGIDPTPAAIEESRMAFLLAARFLYLHISMEVPYTASAVDAISAMLRGSLTRARA